MLCWSVNEYFFETESFVLCWGFIGILKIRVGWVLEAMKYYLAIVGNKKRLEDHSPFEVRALVYKILSIKEWDSQENAR